MKAIGRKRKIVELESFNKKLRDSVRHKKTYRDFRYLPSLLNFSLNMCLLSGKAYRNCLDIQIRNIDIESAKLPASFNQCKVLFLSDLHIDSLPDLVDIVEKKVDALEYDLVLLGGDYRFRGKGGTGNMERKLRRLLKFLCSRSSVFGVLGNHDEYSTAAIMEDEGVKVLFNESGEVRIGDDSIYIAGVDDDFLYGASDIEEAFRDVPGDGFTIFLSHSPALTDAAEQYGASLALSGHTHGGQICLPGGIPVIAGMKISREKIYGLWRQSDLTCYTSSGVGVSLYPARLFCKPEVVLFNLTTGTG